MEAPKKNKKRKVNKTIIVSPGKRRADNKEKTVITAVYVERKHASCDCMLS